MIQARTPPQTESQGVGAASNWRHSTERSMEHRLHRRVEIAIPARLHFRDGAFIAGLAANISQGGLFIKTSMWCFREGCVDVRLRLSEPDGERQLRIPAFIIHRTQGGMGLMFRELDAEAEAWVSRLLQQGITWPKPVPRHRVPAVVEAYRSRR